MKTPAQLREAKGERVEQLDAISKAAQVEGRELTTEESQRAEDIIAEVETLDGQITRAAKIESTLKANAVAVDMSASSSDKREKAQISEGFSLTEGIRALAQGRPLDGVLREMDQEARKEAGESGISLRGEFNIPSFLSYGERTAYAVDGTDGNAHAAGSNIVQKINAPVALSLQAKSVLQRAGATQLSGFSGDVQLPVMPGNSVVSDGGNGGANETDAVTPGTSAMTSTVLKPTRFAGAVDISKHLMYSMNGQLDDLFGRDLGNAIASKFDAHVLDAVRAKLVTGDRHSASAQAASATTPAKATNFADVAKLMGTYLGGNPDDLRRAFFMSPEIYGHLLGQTADAGGMIQAGNFQEQVMGHPAYTSTNVNDFLFETLEYFGDTDTSDTISATPIMCVDASDIFVCTWAGLSINVDVYTEALKGVVRVIADGYMDGNLRRAGSGAIAAGLTVDTAY
jgi:HK97 family phage major capsid protein